MISNKKGKSFKERNLLVKVALKEITLDIEPDPRIERVVQRYYKKLAKFSKRVSVP